MAIVAFLLLFNPESEGANTSTMSGLSFLGRTDLPRGIRNNNPGNIEQSANRWRGKVPIANNTDERFEQFSNYYYGIRAMIVLLTNYIEKQGRNTIRTIIERYAPAFENNVSAYANAVSAKTGIGVDEPITAADLQPIIIAMAFHENGQQAITPTQYTIASGLV